MAQGPKRASFTSSALIRLLVQLTDAQLTEPAQTFAERLSGWLNWTDAIALSGALNGSTSVPTSKLPASAGFGSVEADAFLQVRTSLNQAITQEAAAPVRHVLRGKVPSAPTSAPPSVDTTADFSIYRQRYVAKQQLMESAIGPLRERVRTALARRSESMSRLAAVDTLMEQVVGSKERSLLSTIPTLLERHFERLRRANEAQPSESTALDALAPGSAAGTTAPDQWRHTFERNMRAVLLAELELRLQPVEGLLEALRMSHSRPS